MARWRLGDAGGREGCEEGAERLEDQVDQGDHRPRQTAAAGRGDALGELAELLGQPLRRGVGGWGGWGHALVLE